MAYIYIIKNDINSKVYIGKTNFSIEKRFKEHLDDSKRHRKEKRPLYNAIQKYGSEHFYIEELEECPIEKSSERECFWIQYYDSYKNGYNATFGGDGKTLINYHKILQLYDNTNCTAKEIADIVQCHSDSVKNIVSQYRNNPNWVERYLNSETFNKTFINQPVRVKCIENNKEFNSTMEAARWLVNEGRAKSVNCRTHISDCCKGKRKTCCKYHWEYI